MNQISSDPYAYLAAIVTSSDDAIISKDLNGTITSWNPAAERIFGYSAEEAIGQHISLIIPVDRLTDETYILGQIRQGKRVQHFDAVRRAKDGRAVHLSITVSPIKDNQGQIIGASKVARDITEIKKAELELQQEREVLETLNRLSRAFASTLDRKELVQMVTDQATKLAGAEFGAFFFNIVDENGTSYMLYTLSGAPAEVFSQFPSPRATAIFAPTFKGEGTILCDDIAEHSDYGTSEPYRSMQEADLPMRSYLAVPVTSSNGQVHGGLFLGHSQPKMFTARSARLTEAIAMHAALSLDNAGLYERLQTSENKWRALAEAMPQLVWMCNGVSGECTYLGSQWESYTGKPVADSLGDGWLSFLHPEDQAGTMAAWQDAVAGRAPYSVEFRIRRYDGEYRWFKTRGVPVRDESGVANHWYGTCTDIQGVIDAKEAAEAASMAKTEFLANMSHEIRTPMNAVVGLANLLEMSAASPARQKEFIATLKLSAQQLMELINDLLDIAKLEAKQIQLERLPFTLDEILSEVTGINAVKAKEKNINLRVEAQCPTDIKLIGDPLRLRQILMNIVGNAVKFTSEGEVVIGLSCLDNSEEKISEVRFDIRDTGIGIAANKIDTIFSKFSQADTAITRKYGGTGLGLSITKSLVEIMGGKISVESAPGQGSIFTIRLPFAISNGSSQLDSFDAATWWNISHEEKAGNSQCHILLVEDFEANILVATSMLESFGYKVSVAHNGLEAATMYKAGSYDLVLMDVQMPIMDGYRTTQAIREHEGQNNLPRTPIVGMTAHALQGDRERCMRAGMDDYIAKPFQPNDLKEKITFYLRALCAA